MADSARVVGRYEVLEEIAAGGMATIHLGRVLGSSSAAPKFIAVKRMHAQYARDPDFRSMFLDEARLCARIEHENVVPTIDVVEAGGELLLILELVDGESVSKLAKQVLARGGRVPIPISTAIVIGLLHGLHAAHEAVNETGEPLQMVHRDVSPHNILVGTDGVARVLDFGVAKARGRMQQTQHGQVKGKIAYMSPEQARGKAVDRRSDVFAAGIVLWELLTGKRLFDRDNEAAVLAQLLTEVPAALSERDPSLAPYDTLVKRALAVDPTERFPSALDMATVMARDMPQASRKEVSDWVRAEAAAALAKRAELIARHVKLASRSEFDDTPRTEIDEPSSDDGSPKLAPPAAPSAPRAAPPPQRASLPADAFLTQKLPLHQTSSNDPLPAFRPPPSSGAVEARNGPSPSTGPMADAFASGRLELQQHQGYGTGDPLPAQAMSGRLSDPPQLQSQVSSVSLTTTDLPPPLPAERVRQLYWVGLVTAGSVAACVAALLIVVSRHPRGHADASNHHPVTAAIGLTHVASAMHTRIAQPLVSASAPAAPAPSEVIPSASASAPAPSASAQSSASPKPAPSGKLPTQAILRLR